MIRNKKRAPIRAPIVSFAATFMVMSRNAPLKKKTLRRRLRKLLTTSVVTVFAYSLKKYIHDEITGPVSVSHSCNGAFDVVNNFLCSIISASSIDGDWHQLTVLWWDKVYWALFIDGAYTHGPSESDWYRTEWYPLKGTLRIGQIQHQNNYPTGSFIGQITSFNMWNYRMVESEVTQLAESCVNTPGNMFQWSTFEDKVHGELKLVKPSTCK